MKLTSKYLETFKWEKGARTLDENAVHGAHKRPDVAGPVGVVEASLEGEQAGEDLDDLRGSSCDEERPERDGQDRQDDCPELEQAVKLESCAVH
mgnify:FL=1